MRHFAWPVWAAISCAAAHPVFAQSNTWQVIEQPGGYTVARTAMAGRATGFGLTCERGTVVIAISLAQPARHSTAVLTLRGGAGSASLAILRNGLTNVWVAAVKDPATLDLLASQRSVALAVDDVDYGTISLAGASAAMQTALGGCWRPRIGAAPNASTATATTGDPDEAAVRSIVGSIYGWREGRHVKAVDNWLPLFSPRIRALIDQCEAAVASADPKANGGEGAYAVTGDQGCQGTPFLIDPVLGDAAPFIQLTRPVFRRPAPDAIEVETAVPPAYRKDWGSSEVILLRRSSGRWLIDEITTRSATGAALYSGRIGQMITELRRIAKKSASQRRN